MFPRTDPQIPGESSAARRDRAVRSLRHLYALAWARKVGGWCLLVLPGVGIVATDLARRGPQLAALAGPEKARYVGYALCSVLLWGCTTHLALQWRSLWRWVARLVLVLGAIFAVGGQIYTFARYQSYIDHRAVLVGTSMLPSIGQQLWFDRASFARAILPPLVLVLVMPWLARRALRPTQGNQAFAADLLVGTLAFALFGRIGERQAAPPDVLYLSSMGQLTRARWDHNETVERIHPGPRTPTPVPPVAARPAAKRNVLFVVTESVRAQSVCLGYTADCETTPFSNRAAKDRIPLRQLRALDSTTAISLAIMWSGRLPTESRQVLHSAPLLWEYAHAAGIDTAYWTSQNLLFGNSGAWLEGIPARLRVSATQLEKDPTMELGADDGTLIDFVLSDFPSLREPFVAVTHLSNTHFPYKVDPDHAPFQPQNGASGPGYEREIRNRYHDAVYAQDRHLARLIEGVRARPEGARTVIVFVSDHGEQLREKGAVGHTGTLWDQEVRIPFWVDAPPGTLTPAEERHLRNLETTPTTSIDILPTLLDLLGLWRAPELAELESPMPGESFLRGGSDPNRPLVFTNCTELWACAFKNWGAMKGSRKLLAHQGDAQWGCYDVAADPDEEEDLGPAACADLIPLAEGQGRGRPF
jgi:glucan phosphoethanolaminetransferase (alkaline phosphatase superfamily)